MSERKGNPRSADRARSEQWVLDPVDVRRHARLAKERERAGPFAKVFRYAPLALAAVGAFILYWNFETLREITVDFSAVTSLFADDRSASGDAASGSAREPETVAVEAPAVVGAEASTAPLNAPPAPKASVDALPAARQAAAAPERPAVAAPEQPAVAAPEQPAKETAAASVVPEPVAAERVASAPSPPAAPPAPERFAFGVSVNFVSEGDAAAAVLVVRNGGNRGVSEITWWTSAGTASAGVDYADLGTVVERFAAGQQNRTIRIPIVGDRVVEGPETFYVHLATSEGEVASSEQGQTEVVINDDD